MTRCLKLLPLLCLTLLGACDKINFKQASTDATALPKAITIVEQSTVVAAACSTRAGFRLIHGLDHNHDGKLSPYERQHTDIVCNPDPSRADETNAVAVLPNARPDLQ